MAQNLAIVIGFGNLADEISAFAAKLDGGYLRRTLRCYAYYYNNLRTHRSLDKDTPRTRPVQQIGRITLQTILGGLHHQYERI